MVWGNFTDPVLFYLGCKNKCIATVVLPIFWKEMSPALAPYPTLSSIILILFIYYETLHLVRLFSGEEKGRRSDIYPVQLSVTSTIKTVQCT